MALKILTTIQLRAHDLSELEERLAEAKQELFKLRVRSTTKELANHTEIRQVRRHVARIETILTEKRGVAAG